MSLFVAAQAGLAFPLPLSEKYRPHSMDEFVGLDKAKRVLSKFLASPFPTTFLFSGPSGTGKTSMGIVLGESLNAELHHIASQECNVANIDAVLAQCNRSPYRFFGENAGPANWHLVLVDEADRMSNAAQLKFLSALDATGFPPQTIFVFTCNATDGLEPRFLSRCMELRFSSQGMAQPTAELLAQVWSKEAGETAETPNFLRLVQDCKNNVRDAVNSLQVELLAL
jgi:replication-associated recombination protein RarA